MHNPEWTIIIILIKKGLKYPIKTLIEMTDLVKTISTNPLA